jgi:hypothetical protein
MMSKTAGRAQSPDPAQSHGGNCCVRGGVNEAIAKAVFEQGIRHADSSTDL